MTKITALYYTMEGGSLGGSDIEVLTNLVLLNLTLMQ